MSANIEKRIPAAYLRSQEFARQKLARKQKRYERLEKRHERENQRLAAVLDEKSKEVRMDEQHPERIYIKEQHLEKFYALLDAHRNGSNVSQFAFSSQLAIWYPATKEKTYVVKYVERQGYPDVLQPYLEPANPDDPEHLQVLKAQLDQRLAGINQKLKGVAMDELKSKMLTLLEPGEVVTVSKPDPNALTGPQLGNDAPA
jgi:hypothetical protein